MKIAITSWGQLWGTVTVLAVASAVIVAIDALKVHDLGLMWIGGAVSGVAATFIALGLIARLTGRLLPPEPPPAAPPAPSGQGLVT